MSKASPTAIGALIAFAIVAALSVFFYSSEADRAESERRFRGASFKGSGTVVMHDDDRAVTCYLYRGHYEVAMSCVADSALRRP